MLSFDVRNMLTRFPRESTILTCFSLVTAVSAGSGIVALIASGSQFLISRFTLVIYSNHYP